MFNWLKQLLHREQTSKKEKMASGFIAFLYIFALGYQGNIMDKGGQAFYEALIKPGMTPPDWIFPFVLLRLEPL
jgi:tryptophan-rich sensory protein